MLLFGMSITAAESAHLNRAERIPLVAALPARFQSVASMARYPLVARTDVPPVSVAELDAVLHHPSASAACP